MAITATATETAQGPPAAIRPAEFRAALERALAAAQADERIGPRIVAADPRLRFVFTDCGLVLDLAAAEDGSGTLSWSFGGEPERTPRLVLEMSSEVANRYLQGRESLAIAIARGQVRVRGGSRAALLYLPAARLVCEPYRRVIESEFPDLVSG